MKILFVDDDIYKINTVVDFLNKKLNCTIEIENAINPGLKSLATKGFDLVLLDMSMPIFSLTENENYNPFGGIDFLREMKRTKNKTPVIIITQYEIFGEGHLRKTSEDINNNCIKQFDNYKGLVVYSSTEDDWKEDLLKKIGG